MSTSEEIVRRSMCGMFMSRSEQAALEKKYGVSNTVNGFDLVKQPESKPRRQSLSRRKPKQP